MRHDMRHQPIRYDSPNAVYPFQPVQGRFSCSPVLSSLDVHDEFETPMATTGRTATSKRVEKASTSKTTQRSSSKQKSADWGKEETEQEQASSLSLGILKICLRRNEEKAILC